MGPPGPVRGTAARLAGLRHTGDRRPPRNRCPPAVATVPTAGAGPRPGWPAFAALLLVFLTAPAGHLPAPPWRWAVWVTGAGVLPHTLGTLTTPPGDFVYGQRDSTRATTAPLLTVGWMLVAVGLL